MADVKLHDGREITFDLYTFTFEEYRLSFEDDEKQAAMISKAVGLSLEEFRVLSFPDNRKVVHGFFVRCTDIIKDPNSESAST